MEATVIKSVIEIDVRDWPRCAKCDMPVTNFYVNVDLDSLEFVSECHGAKESSLVPDSIWDNDLKKIEFGMSFSDEGPSYDN